MNLENCYKTMIFTKMQKIDYLPMSAYGTINRKKYFFMQIIVMLMSNFSLKISQISEDFIFCMFALELADVLKFYFINL